MIERRLSARENNDMRCLLAIIFLLVMLAFGMGAFCLTVLTPSAAPWIISVGGFCLLYVFYRLAKSFPDAFPHAGKDSGPPDWFL